MKVPKGWTLHELGDLVEITSGGTPSRQSPEYWSGEVPWLSAKDLKSFMLTTSIEKLTPLGAVNGTRFVKAGSLLILTRGMTLFKDVPVGYAAKDLTFNQDLKALLPKAGVDGLFLAWSLTASKHRLMRLVDHAGHGTGRLSTELLSIEPFVMPPIREQRRIAAILGAWDRAIEANQKLLQAKTTRLRTLQHQLLTGAKRFPKFKGKWVQVRMNEVLARVFRPVKWHPESLFRLISIRRRCGGLFERERLRGADYKTQDLHTLEPDDFLVSKRQVSHGAWGLVSPHFAGAHVSKEYAILVNQAPARLHMPFFDWLMKQRRMWHLAYQASDGVHIEKLIFDPDDFLKNKILIPPTMEEQRKIATFLDACLREIDLLTSQLDAFKEQRRGLMQKLLTGEVRVH